MTDYHDIAAQMACLLCRMQIDCAYGSDIGCQCDANEDDAWHEHRGDCPIYWDGCVDPLVTEFAHLERRDKLLRGDGLGGPFVRAVTAVTHGLTGHSDWAGAYFDATAPGWCWERVGAFSYSRCAEDGKIA